CARNEDSLDVW
nr:immunoglobulin heavy chain junction region [Macaca mulatta]